jgi:spore coat protein U-like protein
MPYQNRWARNLLASAVLVAVAAMGGTAAAGTATSNLAVSASVAANCTIDASAGTVAFGAYDPIVTNKTTDLTASGSVSTTCTKGSTATLTLGEGTNKDSTSTASAPVRRMLAGTSNYLSYQLYSDSGHTAVFENTTGITVTGTGAAVSTPVYGVVTAGQNVPAGSYADTVVATVSF